jgi:transglutaminase-like putative cysteine protease
VAGRSAAEGGSGVTEELPEQDLEPYRRPSRFIESEHPAVIAFAREAAGPATAKRDIAVRLFYAVRDAIRYDPYVTSLSPEVFKASFTLERGRSFCVPKAILLAAAARAFGIPSRLGFADVRNHLATRRLLELLGTDLFVFHGYTELFLGGRWVKATPTFNLSLCEKFGVEPLDFDGEHDALLHPFDQAGQRHMEYVRQRGTFAELPLEEMVRACRRHYPHLFDAEGRHLEAAAQAGDFEAEALREGDAASRAPCTTASR